jgi:hypothetical protein
MLVGNRIKTIVVQLRVALLYTISFFTCHRLVHGDKQKRTEGVIFFVRHFSLNELLKLWYLSLSN